MEKLKSLPAEEVSTAFRNYGASGFYWLNEKELEKMRSMKLLFAESSPKFCANILTGKFSRDEAEQALEQFSEEEIREWFALSYLSLKAAIENEKNFDINKVELEFQNGVKQIASLMGQNDGQKLLDIVKNSSSKSEEELCWATKTLFQKAKDLTPAQKVSFLRALATTILYLRFI